MAVACDSVAEQAHSGERKQEASNATIGLPTTPANPCTPRIAIMDGRSWVKAQATEKIANRVALASM